MSTFQQNIYVELTHGGNAGWIASVPHTMLLLCSYVSSIQRDKQGRLYKLAMSGLYICILYVYKFPFRTACMGVGSMYGDKVY